MAVLGLRKDERIGLVVAVALHAAVLGALFLDPHTDEVVRPPDRIEVTISDDYGLTSTAPNPRSEAAADVAPTIGEAAPAPAPAPVPEPQPSPLPPVPKPRPVEPARPTPKPKKQTPPEKQPSRKKSAIDQIVASTSQSSANKSATPPKQAGGSRIGADFLKGVQGAQTAQGTGTPAQVAGPKVQSSLLSDISRQLNPYWQGKVPQGADSEKLVTILRWNLNRDGSLAGMPQVVRQEGITEANRPQAGRHAEQAIRAVQLAAPFHLPPEYYDTWKRVTVRFDKRLSQ